MKKFGLLVSAALLVLALSTSAFAMTGTLVNGEPPVTELDFATLDTISSLHDESVDNPLGWYKGWWWVNLTNSTANAWASVKIKAGAGDLVAIVQGNGLEDEWGFVGNSVVSNKAGSIAYSGVLGSRTYENNAVGQLWNEALFTFATPLAPTQKVSFRIYTDNSYYGTGSYASSFCMCLTPNAVPEPAGVMTLMGGIAGLGAFIRRRK